MSIINGEEVSGMIEHWLTTPPNGYLGSSYGSDPKSLLQRPNTDGLGDQFIDKMIVDVPVLSGLPQGAVNVSLKEDDKDSKTLLIDVAGNLVIYDETRQA